jgi:hypothetical protein
MRHVLLAWELGGNRGHLERLHAVAVVLQAKGIRLTFVVRSMGIAAAWLNERGWDAIEAPVCKSSQWGTRTPNGHADWYLLEGFSQTLAIKQWLDDWQKLLEHTQADAALLDYAPFAAYALHFFGIKFLTLGSGFCTPPKAGAASCFRPWDHDALIQANQSYAALRIVFQHLRHELGVRAASEMDELFTPSRVALCIFEEMDHFDRSAQQHRFHGVIWGNTNHRRFHWKHEEGLPKVFAYLNGPSSEVASILQNLKKFDCEIIAVAPRLQEAELIGLTTERLQISQSPLDLVHLMQDCDVSVCHGGLAVSALSLLHGTPVFLIPRYAEQILLSRRLVKSGLALATLLRNDQTKMAHYLSKLHEDGGYRVKAQQFADKYKGATPNKTIKQALYFAD